MATLLIEHLTEETNGSITAAELKKKLKRILQLDVHESTVQRVRHSYLSFTIYYYLYFIYFLVKN